ncbi:hypothetical protein [Leifsonia poae]|uniref:hypothetical protein n=1 Tax=Leifsonia poae TaxID=110933 RepID=UPI003D66E0D4
MTSGSNNFEGGSNGVAITNANSGGASGTAFDSAFGAGFLYSASDATQGTMGASVAGGTFGAGQWNLPNSTKFSAKMKFTPKASPATSDAHLMRAHNGSGGRLFTVHINTAGKLRVDDAVGTSGVFTFSNVLAANTTYRLEAYVVAGTTTSNGTIKVAYYTGNSTTPVESTYLNSAANVGAASNFTSLYMGKYTNTAEAYGFDEFAFDTSLTDFIGVGTTTPPMVSTPPNQNVAVSAAVTAAVVASSSSGTISSYAWSYVYPVSGTGAPTLSGTTTNTVSLTAGSAGSLYTLQCIVTDSNALTTTVSTEVRVPTTGSASALPGPPTAVSGSWSNVGGAATEGEALSDASSTTYVESSNLSGTGQSERFRMVPMVARSSLDIASQLWLGTSGAATAKVRLYQGSTQLQEWTQALTTTTPTIYTFSASSGTVTAITDWGNLYLESYATSP